MADNMMVGNNRAVYNLLDLLSDLGGIDMFLFTFFARFLTPISKHSFNLKAIKKLYMARTKDKDLFPGARKPDPTRKREDPKWQQKQIFKDDLRADAIK